MKRSTQAFLGAAGILIAPGLAGCGGGSSTTPNIPVAPLPRSASAALPNGLTATLAEDRSSVAVGGTVTYTMTLTNSTAQPITFHPVRVDARPSSGVGDALLVLNTAGEGLVTFPQGGFAQVITAGASTTLAPGQSVSGTLPVGDSKDLGQFSAAGVYSASARFTVQTGPDISSLAAATAGPVVLVAQ